MERKTRLKETEQVIIENVWVASKPNLSKIKKEEWDAVGEDSAREGEDIRSNITCTVYSVQNILIKTVNRC